MSKGLLTASIGAGATRGFSNALQHERDRPMRELRLQQARTQQEMAEAQFNEYKENAGVRDAQRDEALALAQNSAYKANAETLQMRTYEAFRRYNEDKDVRHLNTFITEAKRNPLGQNMYGSITRVDAIGNVDQAEAERLMRQAGYADPSKVLNDESMADEFVVATDASGARSVVQMSRLQAMTGYTKHMSNAQLQEAKLKAQIAQLEKYPNNAESQMIRDIAAERKITLLEAARLYNQYQSRSQGSTLERVADTLRASNPGMSEEAALRDAAMLIKSGGSAAEREAYTEASLGSGGDTPMSPSTRDFKTELDDVNARRERTSTQKNADDASATRAELDELAGGPGKYFEADLSDPNERRKYTDAIHRLEQTTGNKLTTEDKRVARNIRDLTNLGKNVADELTPEETGLLDHMLHGFQKYVSDNVDGEAARSSYETFRNIFRNALYGSSLTSAETAAFDKAAGTLGQQFGPVMQQMQVQMQSLRNQLESIYNFNDEYIARYYVGTDLDELDRIIEGIDMRLDAFRTRQAEMTKQPGELPRIRLKSSMSDEEAFSAMDNIAGES